MSNKTISFLILGCILSLVAFYLAFKNVPFHELAISLASINYLWVFVSLVVILITFPIRAYRWQIILGTSYRISFWQAFTPMMIGFMINCILPGRIGEVARPVLLMKKEKIPFFTGAATVATERVFDAGVLLALFAILIFTVKIDSNVVVVFGEYHLTKQKLLMVSLVSLEFFVVFVIGIMLLCSNRLAKLFESIIMCVFSIAGPSFRLMMHQKIRIALPGFIDKISDGLTLVGNPIKLCICTVLSVVIWGLSALSWYIVSLGYPAIDLSFKEIAAVMVIVCFFIALPSVPGFWGIWEAGGIFALAIFGVPAKDAAGFVLVYHAVQIFTVIVIGMISALVTGVNVWQVSFEDQS